MDEPAPDPAPRVPDRLHPLARRALEALRGRPGAEQVVIGGGVALQCYAPYRDTADLDAWWAVEPSEDGRRAIREAMEALAASEGGEVRLRRWLDTESYELVVGERKRFSLQIARRSVALDPPRASAWPPVGIESLRDNLGGKMNALIGRGAPRDLLDIHEVCRRGLATPASCWAAWRAKNPGAEVDEARARVLHHLALLEARRPLESLAADEREAAATVRGWIRQELCGGARS